MSVQKFWKANLITLQLLLAGLLWFSSALAAQEPATPAAAAVGSTSTRACSANPVLPPPKAKKKSSQRLKHPLPPEPPPTCIEVRGEAIEIQEFLQTTAREQAWRIGENRASDDTWSYVRYFGPDELDNFADTKVLLEPVTFTGGKAAVTVRTSDVGDGYVRVQITVHILAEGKSTDKTWTQPASTWPLNSRGLLEKELVTSLQTSYKPLQ